MNTCDLAEKRRQEWLDKHDKHVWQERNLWEEAQEELADAYNYLMELHQYSLAKECLVLGDEVAYRSELAATRGGAR